VLARELPISLVGLKNMRLYSKQGQLGTVEMETRNRKWKQIWSNLDVHVKPLINDHFPKTTSIQTCRKPPTSPVLVSITKKTTIIILEVLIA